MAISKKYEMKEKKNKDEWLIMKKWLWYRFYMSIYLNDVKIFGVDSNQSWKKYMKDCSLFLSQHKDCTCMIFFCFEIYQQWSIL